MKRNAKQYKRQVHITYFIQSMDCMKKIVSGVRSFPADDNSSTKFIKRLVSVKNALCERVDSSKFNDAVREQRKQNATKKKYHDFDIPRWQFSDGMPFKLSYSAQTI